MAKLGKAISLKKKNYTQIEDDTEYQIAGVQSYGKGVVIRRAVKGFELTMKKYQVIRKNQLMWCKVDTKNGAFGITKEEHVGSLASTNMALAEINEDEYLPEFIETLFQLKPFYEWITKYSSGSTNRKYLTPTELLEKIEIPNLSLDEQKEFQAKVNFVKNSGLFKELNHQTDLLKKLRQRILQEAIEGKLTADWRTENPDVEPASALLERIQAEKAQLVAEKKIRKQKELPPINEDEIPFELPQGWEWARVGNISPFVTVGYVGAMKNQYVESGVPFLRSQNVRENRFRENGLVYISQAFHKKIKKSTLNSGDVVVVRSGNVGVTCVIPNDFPEANCSDLVIIKQSNFIVSNYISFFMNSVAKAYVKAGTVGIALTHFNTKSVAKLPVPLPPLPEQEAIVAKVEKLLALCDQLEGEIAQNQDNAEKLMQAVLREAFSSTAR